MPFLHDEQIIIFDFLTTIQKKMIRACMHNNAPDHRFRLDDCHPVDEFQLEWLYKPLCGTAN